MLLPITSPQFFYKKILTLFALLFTASSTLAENKTEEPLPSIKILEEYNTQRDLASKQVTRFANWVDNFFANDFAYDELQGSHIKLFLSQTSTENEKTTYDTKIKAKLELPKTQKKFQLLIESLDEEEDEDTAQTSISNTAEDQDQSIALSYIQKDTDDWRITNIAGIRFRSGLDPFIRIRFRHSADKGAWTYRVTENLFWSSSGGIGETTRLDINHPLMKKLLFRSTTQATYRFATQYFDLGQDLILFQNINRHKSLAYQTGYRATMVAYPETTDYFFLVRYRQQIHSNWLFFDIIPMTHHPVENDFKPVRSITLKLEIVFDAR